MGDPAPPPPPLYVSPSERRKQANRESSRPTSHSKEGFEGIRVEHDRRKAVGKAIKPRAVVNLDQQSFDIRERKVIQTHDQPLDLSHRKEMSSASEKNVPKGTMVDGGRKFGEGKEVRSRNQGGADAFAIEEALRGRRRRSGAAPAGLLMAPPGGGGDYGEPGEGSTRPKPTGGQPTALQRGRVAEPDYDRHEASDGNWDDGDGMDEEPGLRQGRDTHLGGEVDMEDDVYLEFDEEDDVPVSAEPRTAWKMLARYMAHTRPNAMDMFTYFSDVWHLRTQIKYTELQKNYYILTFFSQGDLYFVARGGPWIFNKNALLVKEIKDDISPSEMILDVVPVWVRVYDVLWGKQNYETGMKFGNLLGRALEVDAPTEEKDMNEFLRVRVELPYDRRLQTQIATGVKGRTTAGKVYKLKYERVPHYCAHCGFMGHRKFECEKKRRGVPSLDYNVYELRCSPYKKYEHRSHVIPAAGHPSARRNLSFASFGSAESRKNFRQANPGVQSDQVPSHNYVSEQVGSRDGFEENVMPGLEEVNQTLSAQVEAMQVKPIVQLPEDGALDVELRLAATKPVIQEKVVKRAKKTSARKPGSKTLDTILLPTSPGSSDMIPALHGLNSMVVSFGGSDETMLAVDQTPRKRSATETADKEYHILTTTNGVGAPM
ncbi:hypothetical protein ACQ4PT_068002 [Festuca glaucescens]